MKLKLIKSLIGGLMLMGALTSFGQGVPSASPSLMAVTNIVTAQQTNIVLLTNANKIASIQLVGGANATNGFIVQLFDNNATNQTYTNTAYTNYSEVVTNISITNVSGLTGVTNIFTNTQIFGTNIVVAASTNTFPSFTFATPASLSTIYPVNIVNAKGLMITASTNGLVIVTYRLN